GIGSESCDLGGEFGEERSGEGVSLRMVEGEGGYAVVELGGEEGHFPKIVVRGETSGERRWGEGRGEERGERRDQWREAMGRGEKGGQGREAIGRGEWGGKGGGARPVARGDGERGAGRTGERGETSGE